MRESRQFILRQGQTVPVEKVKRVSRASVEHLSRHSELITKVPEPGGDLRPDKLHMTENVGTFAVYENRFLYMLFYPLLRKKFFSDLRHLKYLRKNAAGFAPFSELPFSLLLHIFRQPIFLHTLLPV